MDAGVIGQFQGSFVRIRDAGGAAVGAGFLATDEGDVLTCAHVVAQALGIDAGAVALPEAQVALDFPFLGAAPSDAAVRRWMPQSGGAAGPAGDIAVLSVAGPLPAGACATRLTMEQSLFGRRFRAHGYPRRFDAGVFAYGELRDRLGNGWLQVEDVSATGRSIEPGFSGGPVQDRATGRVIGMVVAASANAADTVAFVIPADLLARTWPALAVVGAPPVAAATPGGPGASRLLLTRVDAPDDLLFSGETSLVRLGRDPTSDVVLPQPASWEHGRILLSGGAYVYQHLGRRAVAVRHRTGDAVTLVRGERAEETLRQADALALLPDLTVTVRFELQPETDYEPTAWRTAAAQP